MIKNPTKKLHHHLPHSTQAERILARFGNGYDLSRYLKQVAEATGNANYYRSPSVIYRWAYPRQRGGCDGLIPNAAMPGVLLAAKVAGIFLTDEDTRP